MSPPPDAVAERIYLVFNNVSMQNLEQKALETRVLLEAPFLPWLGNYLVAKRISTQPNFHTLYMAFLLKLESPELLNAVLISVFHNVSKLLDSPKITTSTSERSLLKNLGSWLGQMTLARNKPILQRRLDVKELLCQGFETGRLIAVTPFVAKIMEGGKESRVFRPPNPWIMGLMGALRELYDLDDLKMNIKFEIEVLCKNLGLKIDDVPPQRVLCHRLQPRKDKTPDFNVRPSANVPLEPSATAEKDALLAEPPSGRAALHGGGAAASAAAAAASGPAPKTEAPLEQTVIPNLAAYVTVNASLAVFASGPASLKAVVPLAVDRAIREIIQPVVERSVTIACINTKELVVKDFAMEGSVEKMRKATQLMVANLAGSLAAGTCKEPLRASMVNNLRTLLMNAAPGLDAAEVERAAQTCSTDNVDLGCMLIEKAATEGAQRDIDEQLAAPFAARRKAAAQGQPFVDEAYAGKRYPAALPEMLRPTRAGLGPAQLLVYEAFAKQAPKPPPAAEGGPVSFIDSQQAMFEYGRLVTALEAAIGGLAKQAPGRALSLAMLGPEHEIAMLVRQTLDVTQKIAPADREAGAFQFARSVFVKKIVEPVNCEGDNPVAAEELLKLECYVGILGSLREECKKLSKELLGWIGYLPVPEEPDARTQAHRIILMLLVRFKLCRMPDLDVHIAVKMNGGTNLPWVDFAMVFAKHCILERVGQWGDFGNVFDGLGKAAHQRPGLARKISKFMEDLRSASPAQGQLPSAAAGGAAGAEGAPKRAPEAAGARDQVMYLLERWIRVWNESGGSEQKCVGYITLLHQQNVLKSEEMTEVFLRIATELCVEACVKTAAPAPAAEGVAAGEAGTQFVYKVLDAYSSMLVLLVKYASADPQSVTSRVQLLSRILSTVDRVLLADAAESGVAGRRAFDQRPYLRIFTNLLRDLNTSDPVVEQNNLQVLGAFAAAFNALQPSVVPAFAFAWLELVSHRSFMPALLLAKPAQKGWMLMHRLLIALFAFMEPFLRRSTLPVAVAKLYKGTLRVLLVLLHDFPEFLADYHFSFCDVIPPSCIQLRNLFLSAFPRAMRLPDPFTQNLKVDMLPEISQPPRILSNVMASLAANGLRQKLDAFLETAQPKTFLEWLPDRLRAAPADAAASGCAYNVPAINSLVVYVGAQGIAHLQNKALTHSPVMAIFQCLMASFDAEGRYLLLNAIANQLRYPNNHTHYFSCVLLYLFSESADDVVKEQITRVLLERLIVHRPHPWGLLITFIELIKNPRYDFWSHKFTRCAPEIEKVFESVSAPPPLPCAPAPHSTGLRRRA